MRTVEKITFKALEVPKTIRVAAYARVSSGKDAMLHSLSAQVSYYSTLIQANSEWTYCGVYADEAKTGTKDTRENFQRMLTDCRSGKIDLVITKSISRFARNTVTLLETVRELKSLGVDVYFEEQNIHTLSADGEMMLTILASYAQEESLSASENQKWRIRKNFEQGIPNTFSLYGYRCINKSITVYEPEAKVVRQIFEMYLSGIGSITIANHLNSLSIHSPSGNEWVPRTIVSILKNEKYIGNMLLQKFYTKDHLTKKDAVNKGELPQYYVEGSHDGIISKEVFDEVKAKFDAKPSFPNTPKEYDFKGMVFCGICGSRYVRKKNYKKYVWRCHVFHNQGKEKCQAKQVPDSILKEFAESFEKDIFEITVLPNNRLHFIFEDKSEITTTWEQPSRRDSWTAEMKEAARQQSLSRKRGDVLCQEQ